jgi:hypothetical protein
MQAGASNLRVRAREIRDQPLFENSSILDAHGRPLSREKWAVWIAAGIEKVGFLAGIVFFGTAN